MPFFKRPAIIVPDRGALLWRYVDYPRFLSLLVEGSLAFVRSDLLGDRYEGYVSELTRSTRNERYPESLARLGEVLGMFDTMGNRLDWYVSCWHESANESAQMWATYGDAGLAIRTTFGRLVDSLSSDTDIIGGRVSYRDFASTVIPDRCAWSPLMYKQAVYLAESEVRILTRDPRGNYRTFGTDGFQMDVFAKPAPDPETASVALGVPVDLSNLIEAVVLGPEMPSWQVSLIRRLVDLVGLPDVPVIRSDVGFGVST